MKSHDKTLSIIWLEKKNQKSKKVHAIKTIELTQNNLQKFEFERVFYKASNLWKNLNPKF